MSTEENWKNLEKSIKSCKQCAGLNRKDLGTLNAPGYGNKESKVVFIGQSLCGKPCIDAQIPFTGGSGRILDQAFEMANTKKKDIYITNVVKCHPDKNRKSQDHEVFNCTPFLKQEINWISPKEIICLGKDAWGFFKNSILRPCKKTLEINSRAVTVHFVYHPSYIMKKPKDQRDGYISYLSKVIESVNT